MNEMILANKNAVITGASDGIGLAIAKKMVQQGAAVLLIARDTTKLEKAKRSFVESSGSVNILSADLSDPSVVQATSEKILEAVANVDILVNNAGIANFVKFQDSDETVLDNHLNLNIKVPYLLTRALLESLRKNNGCIINISSFFAERMLRDRPSTAYSLSKGAVNSFTKSLAFELGPLGIRVNAIAPGSVQTPQLKRNFDQLTFSAQERFRSMINEIYPLGRIGECDDVAGIATFLASHEASWITGGVFSVDGGLTTN